MLADLFIGPIEPATNNCLPPNFAEALPASSRAISTARAFMRRTSPSPFPYSDCTKRFAPKVPVVTMSEPAS